MVGAFWWVLFFRCLFCVCFLLDSLRFISSLVVPFLGAHCSTKNLIPSIKSLRSEEFPKTTKLSPNAFLSFSLPFNFRSFLSRLLLHSSLLIFSFLFQCKVSPQRTCSRNRVLPLVMLSVHRCRFAILLVYRRWLSGLRVLLPFCNLSLLCLLAPYFLLSMAASRSSLGGMDQYQLTLTGWPPPLIFVPSSVDLTWREWLDESNNFKQIQFGVTIGDILCLCVEPHLFQDPDSPTPSTTITCFRCHRGPGRCTQMGHHPAY